MIDFNHITLQTDVNVLPVTNSNSHVSGVLSGAAGALVQYSPKPHMYYLLRGVGYPSLANPVSFTFYNPANYYRYTQKVKLSWHTKVRLINNLNAYSAVSNDRMKLVYKTGAFSSTYTDYADLAQTGECAAGLSTLVNDSGWVDLPTALIGDDIEFWVALGGGSGDATDTHQVRWIAIYFK